jgi:hypothetical protein
MKWLLTVQLLVALVTMASTSAQLFNFTQTLLPNATLAKALGFGNPVCISGSVAAAGATGMSFGSAYVYQLSSGGLTWSQTQQLFPPTTQP